MIPGDDKLVKAQPVWYYKQVFAKDSHKSEAYSEPSHTAQNTVFQLISWCGNFCGKTQFLHSFRRIVRNYAETEPFHTRKLGEITVFYAVSNICIGAFLQK